MLFSASGTRAWESVQHEVGLLEFAVGVVPPASGMSSEDAQPARRADVGTHPESNLELSIGASALICLHASPRGMPCVLQTGALFSFAGLFEMRAKSDWKQSPHGPVGTVLESLGAFRTACKASRRSVAARWFAELWPVGILQG